MTPALVFPDLCAKHGLTSYDAAYLALARDAALPLATKDGVLGEAAQKSGIALFGRN